MANVKWIKINTDMFDNSKIRQLRLLPEGNNIVLIWVMLLTMAGKCNAGGMLILAENIPYSIEMLAGELGFEINTVRMALVSLKKFNMISDYDDCISITGWNDHQNIEGMEKIRLQNNDRQKKYRAKEKQSEIEQKNNVTRNVTCNVTDNVTSRTFSYSISNSNISNLYILIDKHKYKDYINNNNRLLDSIKEWMEYKDQKEPKKSNHYDTEVGMSKLLTEIVNKDKQYGTDNVIQMIDRSMSRSWTGIIWDGIDKLPKPVFNSSSHIVEPKEDEPEMSDEEWLKMMQESDE